MITQTGIYCAAAALIAAIYLRVMVRLAPVLKRKLHFSSVNAAMLPLVLLLFALIYLELRAVHDWAPGFEDAIGTATFFGLAIGRILPFPGGGGSMRFGFGDDDMSDSDGDFDGDSDSGSGD
ncbi:hypothetical protein ACELLULO517_12355 [Acidisoma cellulosilytica]|uniref:Uncharacterized protein n=1 Tax=Acidisoma cellulosilyticum TaxID=2802395 RepID=A0A963Z1K5_9PROT|nr:hypothetical protein [Acidisoma cellulosilyticum]MCB8881029.1 hypothetical protein [Acidisoma cellulosilyticum]